MESTGWAAIDYLALGLAVVLAASNIAWAIAWAVQRSRAAASDKLRKAAAAATRAEIVGGMNVGERLAELHGPGPVVSRR